MSRGRSIIFLGLFLLSSCAKLISDEFPDFDSLPAMNCILIGGQNARVHLSLTEKIDTTYLTLLDNASIEITDQEGNSEVLTHGIQGLYPTTMQVIPGAGYTITAQVDGYETLNASDIVPAIVPVEILSHTNRAVLTEDAYYRQGLDFRFHDNPDTKDFYEVLIWEREEYRDEFRTRYPYNENEAIILNEGMEPFYTPTVVFSDELMLDSTVEMTLHFGNAGSSTRCWGPDSCYNYTREHTIMVELRHVSEAYYRFIKDFYLYEKNRYAFFVEGTATAMNIYSNVANGFGIVAAYSRSIDSVFVEEEFIPADGW